MIGDPESGSPQLVGARPFDLVRFALPATEESLTLRLGIEAYSPSDGILELRQSGSNELPEGATLAVYSLDDIGRALLAPKPICMHLLPQPWDMQIAVPEESRDHERLVLIIGPGDLDPEAVQTITIQLDRGLSRSMADLEAEELATLTDLGQTSECRSDQGSPIEIEVEP